MKLTIIKGFASGAVVLILTFATQLTEAQTVSWGSAFGDKLVDSAEIPLTSEFKFEIGTFNPGFDPAAHDPSLWEADWQGFDLASTANAGFADAIGFINRSVAIDETGQTTSTAFSPAVQNFDFRDSEVYLWAYRDKGSVQGGNEFALITDPSWHFPATVSPTGSPLSFRLAITNTAVLGAIQDADFTLKTAAVGSEAVPEPTTGLLLLLGSCCLIMRRTRNRSNG
ncbi:MAG: PEP-CTERM sorting domain-containing protein [Verrucomicrobia bacterium]|nr:PEP-CTERM sorting domain-containing protein [Verrucomicrobiota bacterium]